MFVVVETSSGLQGWKEGMKNEVVAEMGLIKIFSKTVNVLMGSPLSGKTSSCLWLTADAIEKKNKVLYVDTEKTSVVDRPVPNLLRTLIGKNEGGFNRLFFHTKDFGETAIFEKVKTIKPNLLIIDSVYEPFNKTYHKRPRERAVAIREFVYRLRELASQNGIGIVLTTQTTKNPEGGEEEPLGGSGLLYATDIKAFFCFPENEKGGLNIAGTRIITIDRQISFKIVLGYGGEIRVVDDDQTQTNLKPKLNSTPLTPQKES